MNYLEKAKKHIDEYGDLTNLFSDCGKLYAMTTENIGGFLKQYDLNGKKILTVAASGDHRLNSYLLGASEVTTFDINMLSKLQLNLKDQAIKHLDYDEFIRLFNLTNSNTKVLDPELFKKIEDYLDEDTYSFFHYILSNKDISQNSIYYPIRTSLKNQQRINIYLHPESYYDLRNKIEGKSNRFIHTDIDHLRESLNDEKFDVILLSNISDYTQLICPENPLGHYKEIIDRLKSLLTENGIIQFGYIYSRYSPTESFSEFRVNGLRNKYFSFGEYKVDFFASFYENGTYDKALVYQKTMKK